MWRDAKALLVAVLLVAASSPAFGIAAVGDTYVDSKAFPINFGSSPTAFVGRANGSMFPIVDRALLQFVLPSLSPTTFVASARLRIFIDSTSSMPFALPITAALLSAPFNENTVTWNIQPGVLPSPTSSAPMSTLAGDWFEIDVTDLVRATIAGSNPQDFFVRLAANDETTNNDDFFAFRTKEFDAGSFAPQLILDIPSLAAPVLSPFASRSLLVVLAAVGYLSLLRLRRPAL